MLVERGSFVMVATPRMWPTFSATSTSTTGRNIASVDHVPGAAKSGTWNCGTPIQAASEIACEGVMPVTAFGTSNAPVATAYTKPIATPMKMEMRPRNPRNTTAARIVAASVIEAATGSAWKFPTRSARG